MGQAAQPDPSGDDQEAYDGIKDTVLSSGPGPSDHTV